MSVKSRMFFLARILAVLCLLGIGSRAFARTKITAQASGRCRASRKFRAKNRNSQVDWVFDAGDFLKSSVVVLEKLPRWGGYGYRSCLGRRDRKEKWRYEPGLASKLRPFSTKAWCAGSTDGFLYALDAASGKLKWKYETDGEIMPANQAKRPNQRIP